jgi:hypothetical protein
MGQYFRLANLDKKEWIEPDGWKLWELCANNSIRMLGYLLATDNWDGTSIARLFFSKKELSEVIERLRADGFEFKVVSEEGDGEEIRGYGIPVLRYFGRWCGDRIAVIGDYADVAQNVKPDFPTFHELEENTEWKDITPEVEREFNLFIELDELKVGADKSQNINPDMIITENGLQRSPKIVKP